MSARFARLGFVSCGCLLALAAALVAACDHKDQATSSPPATTAAAASVGRRAARAAPTAAACALAPAATATAAPAPPFVFGAAALDGGVDPAAKFAEAPLVWPKTTTPAVQMRGFDGWTAILRGSKINPIASCDNAVIVLETSFYSLNGNEANVRLGVVESSPEVTWANKQQLPFSATHQMVDVREGTGKLYGKPAHFIGFGYDAKTKPEGGVYVIMGVVDGQDARAREAIQMVKTITAAP